MPDQNSINDFTTSQYSKLLSLAKKRYKFISYLELDNNSSQFILWRHDCDFSLNRALRLAKIEYQHDVKATYFLRIHSEAYNLLEKSQTKIVENIIALGHEIGLHFDTDFYNVQSEDQLNVLVRRESEWLKTWFGAQPVAFSFHTPNEYELSCERQAYGGLINCYSRAFKRKIPYCSDSNGYWRFERLHDVLELAEETCLQVLTHPELWQETALYPRERIFRSVYGRAKATMNFYDNILVTHGRENLAGPSASIKFLKEFDVDSFQFCDYLWNRRKFQALLVELWRLHEKQMNQLCKALFFKEWNVPAFKINAFFEDLPTGVESWVLFKVAFGESCAELCGHFEDIHERLIMVYNQILKGRIQGSFRLEDDCIHLCGIIEAIARWGLSRPMTGYDGITPLGRIGLPTEKIGDDNECERLLEIEGLIESATSKKWLSFLQSLKEKRRNDKSKVRHVVSK